MLLVPQNSPIIVNHAHNHGPGHNVEQGQFPQHMRDRAVTEDVIAREIYEEAARR